MRAKRSKSLMGARTAILGQVFATLGALLCLEACTTFYPPPLSGHESYETPLHSEQPGAHRFGLGVVAKTEPTFLPLQSESIQSAQVGLTVFDVVRLSDSAALSLDVGGTAYYSQTHIFTEYRKEPPTMIASDLASEGLTGQVKFGLILTSKTGDTFLGTVGLVDWEAGDYYRYRLDQGSQSYGPNGESQWSQSALGASALFKVQSQFRWTPDMVYGFCYSVGPSFVDLPRSGQFTIGSVASLLVAYRKAWAWVGVNLSGARQIGTTVGLGYELF
jgi:hypothetical protein